MTHDDEQTLLGHMIRFPERPAELAEGIDGNDFEFPKHKAIFETIIDHMGEGFDYLVLSNALKAQGWEINPSDLIAFEGFAFDGVDTAKVKDRIKVASQKRNLCDLLSATIRDIKGPDCDFQIIKEGLIERISALSPSPIGSKLIKRPSDFSDEIHNSFQGSSRAAIRTSLKGLDDLLGGLRPNELTVVTGETASGKTTFTAAYLPYCLSQQGHPTLIASFEMKPAAIIKKMVQMTKGRPFNELTRGEIQDGLNFVSELTLSFIDVYGELGLRDLKACLYHARKQDGIEIAVLDHLHYFLKYNADQERQAIDLALRNIKSWAMDLDIHILLIVHPTKLTYDNQVVHLNDLKGSSGLKQIPDNVLSIWRPRGEDNLKKPKNEIILYVLKVRDDAGDEGKVILTFDKRSQTYEDSGHGGASPSEGKGFSHPSPRSRPGRDWINGNDQ
jgi:replicative DNA helicase